MQTISHKFIASIHAALPFTANAQQAEAIERLSQFILTPESNSLFILKGYAGTGKTNLMAAVTQALLTIKVKSVLMAPTGRAAKVLAGFSGKQAVTIHKKIFSKAMSDDGGVVFGLADNNHTNTIFIVDEASMIGADSDTNFGGSGLLESLFEYVYSGDNCKLIFIGDNAQLPPVGCNQSPALDADFLRKSYSINIHFFELTEVARQKSESGILYNATKLRITLVNEEFELPQLEITKDVIAVNGEELEDVLNSAYSNYGDENVLIVTRSNKRANLFNQNIRNRVFYRDDDLCAGDKLMIVKNNYFWLDEKKSEANFIANGDVAVINKIIRREKMYGFNFAECIVRLEDYENLTDLQVKILCDTLTSESPSLSPDKQKLLFDEVMYDCQEIPEKWKKMLYLKQNPFYNALQVKFSYAVTCHKAQGGQWPCVFIDHGYLTDEMMDKNFIRWLYTALTRATEKVYLINFSPKLLSN